MLLLSFTTFFTEAFATDDISVISATIPNGDVAAGTVVKLVAQDADCDIWYTVDGSEPDKSKTVFLYSDENGIIITEDITVKAIANNAKKGNSKTYEFKYTCSKPFVVEDELWPLSSVSYAVSLDTENKKVGENAIKIVGGSGRYISTDEIPINSDFDYKLSFWIKTERLGIADAVDFKAFLSGAGSEKHPLKKEIAGATLGNYGKSFLRLMIIRTGNIMRLI